MIITPYIFSQIKGQSFLSNTSFGGQSSFKIAPKSFKAIYVITSTIAIFTLAMLYQPMNITSGSYTSVTSPGIRADNRTPFYSSVNQWQERFSLNIRNNFSPYFATSTEYPKHWRFKGSSTPFSLYPLVFLTFVFPLTSYIGLIYFNRSRKNSSLIFTHSCANDKKSPKNTLTMKTCFITNGFGTQTMKKPSKNSYPLSSVKIKRQTMRCPFVFTACTTTLSSSYIIYLLKRTLWTIFSHYHTTKYTKPGGYFATLP